MYGDMQGIRAKSTMLAFAAGAASPSVADDRRPVLQRVKSRMSMCVRSAPPYGRRAILGNAASARASSFLGVHAASTRSLLNRTVPRRSVSRAVGATAPLNMAVPLATALLIAGAVLAVLLSAALGANDVANSLGTAVGTGAISLQQALIIGAVMEFSGAVLFGSTVTKTISSGVVSIPPSAMAQSPTIMLGMCAVLVGTTGWMALATVYGLPVSSTHAVVGSLVGLGLVSGWGINMKGLYNIGLSWVLSPLIGGIVSTILYAIVRKFIVQAKQPAKATRRLLPVLSAATMFTLSMFLFSKGQISLVITRDRAILIAAAVAMAAGGIAGAAATAIRSRGTLKERIVTEEMTEQQEVESIFKVLQVVTACLLSFSHGSNDVSNAIGPFAAMNAAYRGTLSPGVAVVTPPWVLVLGGFGISFGLATWGKPVMETVGKKITKLVPTKGFSVELGTAITVLIASELGLPVSTTHTLIGCIVAVGLATGDTSSINGKVLGKIAFSWGVTLPFAAIVTIVCFLLTKKLVL
ncbi:putative phosphate permease [Porphyridium purpureum]|uniref:Phosphate transporter n=1 Tax=Porphyridium purpureum TaxID=35688 RepID=A0A5J4YS90_PORPP|nr:putative phosphate permease [Porphyridium purpureum]|eukprot:POR9862..scf229_5